MAFGNARIQVRGVNTNRLTAGCMRGVGDCTLSVAVERMADTLAEKIGMDPVEFRLKNQIREGDAFKAMKKDPGAVTEVGGKDSNAALPLRLRKKWPVLYHLAGGSTDAMLRAGAERFRWNERFAGWGKPGSVNGPRHRAVGVGTGCHVCGVEIEGNTSAIVRLNPDGSAKVFCSVGRQGQGSETTQGAGSC